MMMIARLTLREAMAKKTFMAFFIAISVFLLFLIFAFHIDLVEGNKALLNIFGESITQNNRQDIFNVEEIVRGFIAASSVTLMTIGLFLSIFATAPLIPSMLEKGTIDLYLSKPISRSKVLYGRTIGALTIVFINISYLIGGIWIILGLKTGFWLIEMFPIIFSIMILYCIVYSWMILWGLLLNSSALTIMLTYIMFFLSGLLLARVEIYALLSHKIYSYILDFFYYLLPRISEMIASPIETLKNDGEFKYEAYVNSFVIAIAIYFLNSYIFKRKDF